MFLNGYFKEKLIAYLFRTLLLLSLLKTNAPHCSFTSPTRNPTAHILDSVHTIRSWILN